MADTESGEEVEFLSVEKFRELGIFLPQLSGHTLWHRKVICDYCYGQLGTDVLVLQQMARTGIHFMCLSCADRLFHKITD